MLQPHDPLLLLLDRYQRDFPLLAAPFALLADECGLSEAQLLLRLRLVQQQGLLARLGAVFAPNTVGASTLAALAVPPAQLDAVAALVSAQPEVNHNYARDHHYNLWFVLAADSRPALDAALARIASLSGLSPLDLPLQREYHIDLGFALGRHGPPRRVRLPAAPCALRLGDREQRLLAALGPGLPLQPQPFLALAAASGLSEQHVRQRLQQWLDDGVIRRFGFVLRHRELGYHANAMCVWQVPAGQRDAIGTQLAADAAVTLCYARPPQGPHWPYNLFCMVHARSRDEAAAHYRRLNADYGLHAMPSAMLLSTRRYTQRGARYQQGLLTP